MAILAVVCHHSGPRHDGLIPIFHKIGWAGVDLFFVLSGFLISGLLFAEYRKRREIDIKLFLIRRGFKIYPSFYVFLLAAGLAARMFARNMEPTAAEYIHNFVFIQNYLPGVWMHTWSLAVEEHFYILLPIFLLLLVRYSSHAENPFRSIPLAFAAVAAISILSRILFLLYAPPGVGLFLAFGATNSRMDALFFGVLLGYWYHFHSDRLAAFVARHGLTIGAVSAAFLSVPFFLPRETKSFVFVGFTGMYLGFGGLLVLSLYTRKIAPPMLAPILQAVANGMAFVGAYSYSIYLWHSPISFWTPAIARRAFNVELSPWLIFFIYVGTSLIVGIFMARIIEFPVLKMRDRLFPGAGAAR